MLTFTRPSKQRLEEKNIKGGRKKEREGGRERERKGRREDSWNMTLGLTKPCGMLTRVLLIGLKFATEIPQDMIREVTQYKYLRFMCFIWCAGVLCTCVCITHIHCLQRPEEGTSSSGTRVRDSCELPCGYWKSNQNPLEEQPVLWPVEQPLQS